MTVWQAYQTTYVQPSMNSFLEFTQNIRDCNAKISKSNLENLINNSGLFCGDESFMLGMLSDIIL